jgi:hypothetical protein
MVTLNPVGVVGDKGAATFGVKDVTLFSPVGPSVTRVNELF